MSMARVFHGPTVYDPSLATQQQQGEKTKNLRDEFGLGDDEDQGDKDENLESEDSVPKDDFDSLSQKYRDAIRTKEALEKDLDSKNARIEELQRLNKQSQAILVNKHKDLIKALSEEYERQKGTWKAAVVEAGGDAVKLEAKLKLFELSKENNALKEQIKELELVAIDLVREIQEKEIKEKETKSVKSGATGVTGGSTTSSTTAPTPTPGKKAQAPTKPLAPPQAPAARGTGVKKNRQNTHTKKSKQ